MSATETNWTLTLTFSGTNFKTTGHGGCVTSASGFDIVPYSNAALTTVLSFGLNGPYDGVNGKVTYHITFPSAASGTTIFIGVGNAAITSFQGVTDPFDANTLFYWNGTSQDGSTVDMSDATGLVSTGTNHSGAVVTGNVGPYAINFASSAYGTWGTNVASLKVANNYTISFWAKTSQTVTSCPMFYNQELSASTVGMGAQYNNGSTTGIQLQVMAAGSFFAVNKSDGAWHNIVITFASGTVKLYVDGGTASSTTNTNSTVTYNSSEPVQVAANSPLTVFCPTALSDVRLDNVVRAQSWATDNFGTQSNPTSFGTLTLDPGFAVTTSSANYPINNAGPFTMVLNGFGTTWTGATTFTMQGATITNASVASATSATLTFNTLGNNTVLYPPIVSDGTYTANGPNLMFPGIKIDFANFSTRYNDTHGGNPTFGDTWLMTDTRNGIRTTCNDCNSPTGLNSNMAFLSENSTLSTLTVVNALSGLGTFSQANVAGSICGSTYTLKSSEMLSFDDMYVLPVQCFPNGTDGSVVALDSSLLLSTSSDDGAHWARAQDSLGQPTGASWATNTITLTGLTNTLSIGNSVIVTACTPNAWNGNNTGQVSNMVTLTGATGTTISYANTTQPAAWVSGCTVIGPAAANATPWSTAMWTTGRMARIMPVQFCTNQILCSVNPDTSGTNLLGFGINGNGVIGDPVLWRVPQATFLNNPGATAGYQWWQSSTTPGGTQGSWQSTLANATNPTCISAGNVATACNLWLTTTYLTDPAIPGGGTYLALRTTNNAISQGNGQLWLGCAQSATGPFLTCGTTDIDLKIQTGQSAPTAYNFPSMTPSLYTPISGNTPGTGCFQFGGKTGSDYGTYNRCFTLSLVSIQDSPLFNQATPRPGTAGNRFQHNLNGLGYLFEFQTHGDQTTYKDDSPNRNDMTLANAVGNWQRSMTGTDGEHNTTAIYNTPWGTSATWNTPTTVVNQNSGDFTVEFVGISPTTTGTQTAMGGSQSAGNGFMFKAVGSGVMDFIIELGGAGATTVACPSYTINTWFAYIAGRVGTTLYCYMAGVTSPVTTTGSATTLGSNWTLTFGAEADGTQHIWTGSIGLFAFWPTRSLSGTALGNLAAGIPDEIQREFNVIHNESNGRGWGL